MIHHYQYRLAARESFQKATMCAVGVLCFVLLAGVAVVTHAPEIAIFCTMAAALCAFAFRIHQADFRNHNRRAWLTRFNHNNHL